VFPSIAEIDKKYFHDLPHPYKVYEGHIEKHLKPGDVLLDAGCGRSAPVLSKFAGTAARLIGVDLEEMDPALEGVEYHHTNISKMGVDADTVDVVISRAVLEHVEHPGEVFAEIGRVLKPGGLFIALLPNMYHYTAIGSALIPNSLHPMLVKLIEGRNSEDTFPTYYRANTKRALSALAENNGMLVEQLDYLAQYPNYLTFNRILYLLGSKFERLLIDHEGLQSMRGWILSTLRKK
jgi:SAM-dependent methyltransferase